MKRDGGKKEKKKEVLKMEKDNNKMDEKCMGSFTESRGRGRDRYHIWREEGKGGVFLLNKVCLKIGGGKGHVYGVWSCLWGSIFAKECRFLNLVSIFSTGRFPYLLWMRERVGC